MFIQGKAFSGLVGVISSICLAQHRRELACVSDVSGNRNKQISEYQQVANHKGSGVQATVKESKILARQNVFQISGRLTAAEGRFHAFSLSVISQIMKRLFSICTQTKPAKGSRGSEGYPARVGLGPFICLRVGVCVCVCQHRL